MAGRYAAMKHSGAVNIRLRLMVGGGARGLGSSSGQPPSTAEAEAGCVPMFPLFACALVCQGMKGDRDG